MVLRKYKKDMPKSISGGKYMNKVKTPVNAHQQDGNVRGTGLCLFEDQGIDTMLGRLMPSAFMVPVNLTKTMPDDIQSRQSGDAGVSMMIVEGENGKPEIEMTAFAWNDATATGIDPQVIRLLELSEIDHFALKRTEMELEAALTMKKDLAQKLGYLPDLLLKALWEVVPQHKGREDIQVVEKGSGKYILKLRERTIYEFSDNDEKFNVAHGQKLHDDQRQLEAYKATYTELGPKIEQLQKDLEFDPNGINATVRQAMIIFENNCEELFEQYTKDELRFVTNDTNQVTVQVLTKTIQRKPLDAENMETVSLLASTVGIRVPDKFAVASVSETSTSLQEEPANNGVSVTEDVIETTDDSTANTEETAVA